MEEYAHSPRRNFDIVPPSNPALDHPSFHPTSLRKLRMGIRTASLLSVAWVSLLFTADAFAEPVLAVPTGTPKVVSFKFDKINKNPYNIPNRNRQRHRKREEQTIVQLLDNAVSD